MDKSKNVTRVCTAVAIVVGVLAVVTPHQLNATRGRLLFDQFAAPANQELLYGDGNLNWSFTVDRRYGIEVALKGKLRFDANYIPQNIFNSNGDGTYSFATGYKCPPAVPPPGSPAWNPFPVCLTTPEWSFDWSINTDFEGTTGKKLSDFTYELGMDADPGPRTRFTVFDPITPSLVAPAFDHSLGTNSTTNANDVVDPVNYQTNLSVYNVAQNAWNYQFFNNLGTTLEAFNPAVDGNYVIYLRVKHKRNGRTLAESRIQILAGNARPLRHVFDSD